MCGFRSTTQQHSEASCASAVTDLQKAKMALSKQIIHKKKKGASFNHDKYKLPENCQQQGGVKTEQGDIALLNQRTIIIAWI